MTQVSLNQDIQDTYERIKSNDPAITWAIYGYERGSESAIHVVETGSSSIADMAEDFSDGKIQYGFLRVQDPNTRLPKFVLIGWCGEGVPEHRKGMFQSHINGVARYLRGYHVQITARSSEDLEEETIMRKVEDASGAKYSVGNIASRFESAPPKAAAPARSTPLLAKLKAQSSGSVVGAPLSPSSSAPPAPATTKPAPSIPTKLPTRPPVTTTNTTDDNDWDSTTTTGTALTSVPSAYKPTKVDINTLRSQASSSTDPSTDSGAGSEGVVKGGYTPIGKVDIAALRAQGESKNQTAPSSARAVFEQKSQPQSQPSYAPKPIANRFSSGIGRGTSAPVPAPPPAATISKAIGGASKNFTASGGKTPSQLWAERKAAREAASSTGGGSAAAVPPTTLEPVGPGMREDMPPPVMTTRAVAPQAEEEEETGGGVAAMRAKFVGVQIAPSPATARPTPPAPAPAAPPREPTPEPEPAYEQAEEEETQEEEEHHVIPPPMPLATKPLHSAPAPTEDWDESVEPVDQDNADAQAREVAQIEAERAVEVEEEKAEYEEPPTVQHEERSLPPPPPMAVEEGGAHVPAPVSHKDGPAAGDAGAGALRAIVMYEYEKQEENEMDLVEGEVIEEIEMIDDGWWAGVGAGGAKRGLFPSNYVELVEGDDAAPAQPAAHEPELAAMQEQYEPEPEPLHEEEHHVAGGAAGGVTAVAQYDYDAAEENELSFPEGAVIEDIDQVDPDWWQGTYGGHTGLFPANYVELQQ